MRFTIDEQQIGNQERKHGYQEWVGMHASKGKKDK